MAQVELFKSDGTYFDEKENKQKHFTIFWLRCGDTMVPIQCKYCPDEDGKDKQFCGHKEVLKAFATPLFKGIV